MTLWSTRTTLPASAHAPSTLAADRIRKQVIRALRHEYGADAALRTAVRAATAEMLAAHATHQTIRDAIASCLEEHRSILPDKMSLLTGESGISALMKRMLSWTDDALRMHLAAAGK